MTKVSKVDLSLLKGLVAELEASLESVEVLHLETVSNSNDKAIELSKAMGLATGITLEASMLVGDIQSLVQTGGVSKSKDDSLKGLLNILKGGKLDGTN